MLPETKAIIIKSTAAVMIIVTLSLAAIYSIVKINMRDDEIDVLRAQVEYYGKLGAPQPVYNTDAVVDTVAITIHDTIRPRLLIFYNNDSTQAMISQ